MEQLTDIDMGLLAQAIELSFSCPPTDKAYSVGAIIATPDGVIISTGFSREQDNGCHAEEIALEKAQRIHVNLRGATLYSSMEPCSRRLSGKTSCTARIIDAGISRVVFCLREPPHFVTCEGAEKLKHAGIAVIQDETLVARARRANAMLGHAFS